MSRFTVGQTYAFLRTVVAWQSNPDNKFTAVPYCPWETEYKLVSHDILLLKCISEHKVGWDQDPNNEKKYTGYLFETSDGKKYANQYPSASYGQLDDSNDRVIRPYMPNELWHSLSKKEQNSAVDEYHCPYQTADGILSNVYRGSIEPKIDEPIREQLKVYLATLINLCNKHGIKCESHDMMTWNDRTFLHPHYTIEVPQAA